MENRIDRSIARTRLGPVVATVCALWAIAGAAPAQAARNLVTGFWDGAYTSSSDSAREEAFDKSVAEGAGIARIDVRWVDVAPSKPTFATNPADPAYDFAAIDTAVRSAAAHGLQVVFTVYKAPPWAEGPNRPPVEVHDHLSGTWKPNPADFGRLGTALATRYSGSFIPVGATAPLPKVKDYEAWNEENLWAFLDPQYDGKKQVAVDQYRDMLNRFSSAIKKVDPSFDVLIGGLAPYGDDPPSQRTRPLVFLRDLFCLKRSLKPKKCPDPAQFDILGVHPINLSGGPTRSAINDDDASSADVPKVVKVLRAAEKHGTIARHHPVWVTEFWWQSEPAPRNAAIPRLEKHGRWIEQALYLFWKAGASVALNYKLTDDPYDAHSDGAIQTGVFRVDGTPKPAATSFRFPFVLDRTSKRKVFIWGKSPADGKLVIEKKTGSGWRKAKRINVNAGRVFTAALHARGHGDYRARVGDDTTLVWPLRK